MEILALGPYNTIIQSPEDTGHVRTRGHAHSVPEARWRIQRERERERERQRGEREREEREDMLDKYDENAILKGILPKEW